MASKIDLAMACIVFLASALGQLLKRGFGTPVLVSVGFFIAFHIISVTTRRW